MYLLLRVQLCRPLFRVKIPENLHLLIFEVELLKYVSLCNCKSPQSHWILLLAMTPAKSSKSMEITQLMI